MSFCRRKKNIEVILLPSSSLAHPPLNSHTDTHTQTHKQVTYIHCKRFVIVRAQCAYQNFFVFVNWFKYMEFLYRFSPVFFALCAGMIFSSLLFSILIQCGVLLYYFFILNTMPHSGSRPQTVLSTVCCVNIYDCLSYQHLTGATQPSSFLRCQQDV